MASPWHRPGPPASARGRAGEEDTTIGPVQRIFTGPRCQAPLGCVRPAPDAVGPAASAADVTGAKIRPPGLSGRAVRA
ncbi:hypothetical protein [Streptomyces malaysiensis]|uniref:hypothetical protein n=1 Tax=Streptomyces malaysiensis TaxID=92644 RepID=UPI003723FB8B